MNTQKIVLVTGGANGIGRKIVELLLENGYTLIIVDYNSSKLAGLVQELNNNPHFHGKLHSYVCDVSDSSAVSKLISELSALSLVPNILINNAGYGGPFERITEISDFEWDKVTGTNLKGVFNFSRAILPYMQLKNEGKIINIASVQGLIGANLSSTYIATKHGVVGYTKALAAEWGKYGITCNAICPGYVNTDMGAQDDKVDNHSRTVINRTPLGRMASTLDIAYLVEFLISDKASFINGSIITIDGGLTADIGIT